MKCNLQKKGKFKMETISKKMLEKSTKKKKGTLFGSWYENTTTPTTNCKYYCKNKLKKKEKLFVLHF
jgi:hypothetical protein